jgi:hypothetical protein
LASEEEKVGGNWPLEAIPDSARLFFRIHRNWLARDGEIMPGFFKNTPADSGMSCDWEKYSTPEESRSRAKDPSVNGVLAMIAGEIRLVPDQRLAHDPLPTNRAHSQVFGDKDPEVRLKLKRIASWVLRIP